MTIYNVLGGILIAALAVPGLLMLLARHPGFERWSAALRRALHRVAGRGDLGGLEWWHLTAFVAAAWATVVGYNLAVGLYDCSGPGRASDIIGFLNQGNALWHGTNPFNVPDCGTTIEEPDGLAAVLINALAAPAGIAGIAAIWGAIAVSIVPLAWAVAGPDRRYITVFLVTLPLFFPLVSSQIDGASNALVPATILLTLLLARRRSVVATGIGGFLATQRFPTLFPVLGLSGSVPRRFVAGFAAVAVFGAGTLVSYALWGHEFLGPVFFDQLERHSFSLNFWGILLLENALPSGLAVTVAQGVVTLALVGVVFFTVRSPLRAAAITLVGVCLLNQFLSFNILVWILPAVLVGARPRWWVWASALVASANYNLTLGVFAWQDGIRWPSEVLDALLTVLLLGLFIDLWLIERRERADAGAEGRSVPEPGTSRPA